MKHTITLLLTLFLMSCEIDSPAKTQQFEGDIYITLINVYYPKGFVPPEQFEKLKGMVINLNSEEGTESEQEMEKYFKTLIDNDLFDKSCFQVKFEDGEIINVYIDDTEYHKLEKELKDFDRFEEKIAVRFEGSKISNGIYDRAIYSASNIVSVKKTKGKTDWNK